MSIVSHDDDGMALLLQLVESLEDDGGTHIVQVARWFIADDKHGIVRQCAGNGNALLLPTGEQVRRLLRLVRNVETLQQFHGLVASVLRPVNAGEVHGHHHVFQDGQRGKQLEELERALPKRCGI